MQNYKELFKRHQNIQKQLDQLDKSLNSLKSKKEKLKAKLNHDKEEGKYPSGRGDLKQLG